MDIAQALMGLSNSQVSVLSSQDVATPYATQYVLHPVVHFSEQQTTMATISISAIGIDTIAYTHAGQYHYHVHVFNILYYNPNSLFQTCAADEPQVFCSGLNDA